MDGVHVYVGGSGCSSDGYRLFVALRCNARCLLKG